MFIRSNLLTIIWSIIIIILCCIPGKEFPEASFLKIPHLDKIVHFTFYFILSILSVKEFSKQVRSSFLSQQHFLSAFIYGITLGIIIEFIQYYFIPFRDGSLLDGLANALGSVLGLLFVYYKLLPNYFLLKN